MGRSRDSIEASDRERAALCAALDAGRRLPVDWLAMKPGRALRRLRKELRVKQWELANPLGMRQSTVSKIERGLDTRLSTLEQLLGALGCRLSIVPVTGRDLDGLRALNRLARLEREREGRRALAALAAELAKDREEGARR